jgi:hypothetical protein
MTESAKNKPQFKNYEEMADFWENQSVADDWEQPAEFEISPNARRRY